MRRCLRECRDVCDAAAAPRSFAAPSVVELLLNNNRLPNLAGLSTEGFR